MRNGYTDTHNLKSHIYGALTDTYTYIDLHTHANKCTHAHTCTHMRTHAHTFRQMTYIHAHILLGELEGQGRYRDATTVRPEVEQQAQRNRGCPSTEEEQRMPGGSSGDCKVSDFRVSSSSSLRSTASPILCGDKNSSRKLVMSGTRSRSTRE